MGAAEGRGLIRVEDARGPDLKLGRRSRIHLARPTKGGRLRSRQSTQDDLPLTGARRVYKIGTSRLVDILGDMDETQYDLKICGAGLAVDQTIDQRTALAILNLLFAVDPGPPAPPAADSQPPAVASAPANDAALPTGHSPAASAPEVEMSVGEFIMDVGAKRNPDKIVAMAVYLKHAGKEEFQAEDIKPLFQKAGERTPGNFARDWRWAQTAKWIAPVSGNDKIFYVTNSGQQAVDQKFPPELRKQTSQPAGKRTRKKSHSEDE